MNTTFDPNVSLYRFARCYRFRAARLKDKERLNAVVAYICAKLQERFGATMASKPLVQYFEYEHDNILKNLVTLRISFNGIIVEDADRSNN